MNSKMFAALAATAFIASPALAADGAGARFEGRVGVERLTLDARLTDGIDTIDGSEKDSGFSLGVEGGYDVALGRIAILGAYVGIEGSTTQECVVEGTVEDCLLVGRNLTAGGRLGVRVTPKITIYGKGGYSNGQLRVTHYDSSDPDVIWKGKENRGGIHIGGGIETALSSMTYARIEYVRTDYEEISQTEDGVTATLDGKRDQLLLGFGIRF